MTATIEVVVEREKEIVMAEVKKAERIRTLAKEGLTCGEIAKKVDVSYQHVYNTLRMAGMMAAKVERGESMASKMRAMKAEGKTYGEIAKELGVRYQWVHNVLGRVE